MHTTNYTDTLILISPDCPVENGAVPPKPGTVAAMQYERLAAAPYSMTSDDLIFGIHADRNSVPEGERETARATFFSKGQPCLRSSPLVKSYGWGVHHEAKGGSRSSGQRRRNTARSPTIRLSPRSTACARSARPCSEGTRNDEHLPH